jgi:hypothetical protein
LLTPAAAAVLRRVRWQIELLFKLWKSHGHLDRAHSAKRHRILPAVYAKLLALLIRHWMLIATCWSFPDRSLTKAVHTLRQFVQLTADHINRLSALCAPLHRIHLCLTHGARTNKRLAKPSTYQLLSQWTASVRRVLPRPLLGGIHSSSSSRFYKSNHPTRHSPVCMTPLHIQECIKV